MDPLGSATDSEGEEESFSDCCSVLSAEESGLPPSGGKRRRAREAPGSHRLPPRGKEHFRRLTPKKRQAPQPPSRPPLPTTPVPSLSPVPMASAATAATAGGTAAELITAAVPCTAPIHDIAHQETHCVLPTSSEPVFQPPPPVANGPQTSPVDSQAVFLPVAPPGGAPPAPQRSVSSQMAARNFASRAIRLIDEESDSDACQSDAYEERYVFQAQQVVTTSPQLVMAPAPVRVVTSAVQVASNSEPQVMTVQAQVVPSTRVVTRVIASPAQQQFVGPLQQSLTVQQAALGCSAVADPVRNGEEDHTALKYSLASTLSAADDENVYEFYGNLAAEEESNGKEVVVRAGSRAPTKNPPLRRHQRAQGLLAASSLPPPPLDHLSEEEEEEVEVASARDYGTYEQIPRPSLQRTDSLVTVAHLYEDLLVSSRFRLKVTLTNLTAVVVTAALVVPNTSILLYTAFRLVFGTLFPAYYSYKAVKTKNVKEYVKWMMYWIVFAFFTCFETLTDLFLSFWFPFYYELKILVVLWLLSPATRGSSILYRKFVHPWLTRREDDIDNCIAQAKQQGYSTVIQLGTKGVNYATTVLMQTAIKGGGGLVNQLRRSYSSGELADGDMNRNVKALPHIPDDDYDDHTHSSGSYEAEPRIRAESDAAYKPRGSSASRVVRSNKTRSADVSDVYYQDVPDETIQRRRSPRTQDTASRVLSADDLTSGYSSGDPDAGDLIYDLRHDPCPDTEPEEISEPKRSTRVRRTQSLSASTLSLHRSLRAGVRKGEGRGGLRSGNAGRGSGPVDDMGAPASYSSSGHPAAPHHGSSFKRSRPGELYHNDSGRFVVSCYALTSAARRVVEWKCPDQDLSLRYTSKNRK